MLWVGGPNLAKRHGIMKRLGLLLFALALAFAVVGCEDCQPCEDPSQIFCAD